MITPAEQELLNACALLEALRPAAEKAVGPYSGQADNTADQPIVDAWTAARERVRRAAKAWVESKR